MKTIIYHSADFDGIFCREIAKHFLGEKDVQYIGWNFGDSLIMFPKEGEIYILDLPADRPFGLRFGMGEPYEDDLWSRVIWIDHHKSSIASHPMDIPGYRIDGVAACRLAWQWFVHTHGLVHQTIDDTLPKKQDFIDRKVSEPLAVRLAGEYDIWDHRGDGDLELQFGLRALPDGADFQAFLDTGKASDLVVGVVIEKGKACMSYQQKIDADLVIHESFRLKWEGLDFLCLNTGRFSSLTFAALDKPETGHDALLGFMWNGKVWTISLYHAAHRTDLDLSQIAVKYGGGGHRGACGWTCKTLPFLL